MNDDKPIIIIKKKGGHHAGHHGGSWKVAYADFVTAMMAFFLVMWILGLSQDTRTAIASYFNDPAGMMKSHAGGTHPMAMERSPGKPSLMPAQAAILKAQAEREKFKAAKKALENKLAETAEFKALRKFVNITITKDGLRIELLEAEQGLFFERGSPSLKQKTVALLGLIGGRLEAMSSIVVEGHTDSHPYSGGIAGYSNWELSSDRANSARRALVATLNHGQITEVRGYADKRLRTPADPYHFSNRRISILVPYKEQGDASPTQQVGSDGFGDTVRPKAPNFERDSLINAAVEKVEMDRERAAHPH